MSNYSLGDFDLDLERAVPSVTMWASSGWSTVTTLPQTVCGVGAFFGPPFAAPDASLAVTLSVDGQPLIDHAHPEIADHLLSQGGLWHPGRITRAGTYHRYNDGRLTSFRVATSLVPLRERTGYVLSISVRNRGDQVLHFELHPNFDAGGPRRLPDNDWEYDSPSPGRRARKLSPSSWGNDEAVATVTMDLAVGSLAPGEESQSHITVVLEGRFPNTAVNDVVGSAQATERWWHQQLSAHLASLPTLHSEVEGLEAYYRRSLMSGLVCLWDSPSFITKPFLATGGLDGGNMCAYIWDVCGYAPNLVTMMLGPVTRDVVDVLAAIDFNQHYAATLDGSGVGVAYAYSAWSFICLVRALSAHRGIDAALVQRAFNVFEDGHARYRQVGDLLDFGDQENLLEMRAAGWEHVVASPNAERAWCLNVIAELAEVYHVPLDTAALRLRASLITQALQRELWDERAGWFRCRYPDGHSELVYSVQAFDAVRAGCCSPGMVAAILGHVRDGAFLGNYGVSSVSRQDEAHYEVGDPDWSGSGAYEGEATTLALTLWEQRQGRLAWEVLRRVLWMGEQLPYFPQEHYCHRPDVPAHKRMNVVAGLAGAEAVLFGLMGLVATPDGALYFDPQPSVDGELEMRGFCFRDRVVDIDLGADKCRVAVDGRWAYEGPFRRVPVVEPSGPAALG